MNAAADDGRWDDCYAHLTTDTLIVGTSRIERRWRIRSGRLYALSFLDKRSGLDWIAAGPSEQPSLVPPGVNATIPDAPTLQVTIDHASAVSLPSLLATLTIGTIEHRCRVFPGSASITLQLMMPATGAAGSTSASRQTDEPTGIEAAESSRPDRPAVDLIDCFTLRPGHFRLTQVTLLDQTDVHGNLAFEKSYYLEPAENLIELVGNLFFFDDVLSGEGIAFLKHAPLPHARPVKSAVDMDVRGARDLSLIGHGTADGGEGYPLGVIAYSGGSAGRIAALHAYQRQYRPYVSGRDGLFQSNTWGDRSRDARITDAFIRAEIDAGARLGVDIVQVDDGWQSGKTSNWADNSGGVWEGYWSVSKNFWQPNPKRFPNGLKPIIDAASAAGVKFGLWFSPDSADDFAHWDDDANTLLSFHRDLGVGHFKIDGVKAKTKAGEQNLMRLFDKVLQQTDGQVTFDLDVTAEIRPGYFGAMHVGPLFVENRYTDWRRYFPHHTLRTLWTLAHYIDPARLRMEFLNNARNADKYGDADPLQPNRYRADYLFATIMFASPLGWFEVSNLPESFAQEAAPLIAEWKRHRDAIFNGRIVPIGDIPDGASWSGFVSAGDDSTHVLLFRGLNTPDEKSFELPPIDPALRSVRKLGGDGVLRRSGAGVIAREIEPLRFGWFELRR